MTATDDIQIHRGGSFLHPRQAFVSAVLHKETPEEVIEQVRERLIAELSVTVGEERAENGMFHIHEHGTTGTQVKLLLTAAP